MKIYLSNWYQPPCDSDNNVADEKIGFVHDGGAGSMPSVALNNREDQVMMGKSCPILYSICPFFKP